MSITSSFRTDWSGFISAWCLGVTPAHTLDEAELGVETLERHWPERLDQVLSSETRGIIAIAPLLDDGLVIARCQGLQRFAPVMARLRAGNRAALSELRFAAALVELRYVPDLEPPLHGKVLDARTFVDGRPIYFEVITPELAEPIKEAYREMYKLAESLARQNPGFYTELHLTTDITPEVARAALMRATELSPSTTITEISPLGLVRKVSVEHGNVGIAPAHARRPILFAGFGGRENDKQTMVAVTVSLSDVRAARLLRAEAKHFSREEANVLAIDVTKVPSGIKSYAPIIAGAFQPKINRRFGAVVLFSRTIRDGRIEQKWRTLPNPHALIQITADLLREFESLSTELRAG